MPPCQGGCREFEPRLPLIKRSPEKGFFLLAEDRARSCIISELRERAKCGACLLVAQATKSKQRRHVDGERARHEPRLPLHKEDSSSDGSFLWAEIVARNSIFEFGDLRAEGEADFACG